MNCAELAATLEKTLIRERDPRWLDEARRHAEACPSCARLLGLHRVEEDLAGLAAVEPSGLLLEAVMSRIAQRAPVSVPSLRVPSYEPFRFAAIAVGALLLAVAYLVPSPGGSWSSNLWPEAGLIRSFGISAYLGQHPVWAIALAGFAALMILLGLAIPEGPVRVLARPQSKPGDSPCAPV
jgi:hypothetical protein